MLTKRFEARVRHLDTVGIIDLYGVIDGFAEEELVSQAYVQATDHDRSNLLLNFTDVEYINSKGIALIVGILARARRAGVRVSVCGLSDHFGEIFQITRLSDFMTIFPDEASALGVAVI